MSAFLWVIGGLLVLWLALAVAGFVVKGLLWLTVVAAILFLVTVVVGFVVNRD